MDNEKVTTRRAGTECEGADSHSESAEDGLLFRDNFDYGERAKRLSKKKSGRLGQTKQPKRASEKIKFSLNNQRTNKPMGPDMLKELTAIANELDARGLTKEADALDKVAGDLIDFRERSKEILNKREPKAKDVKGVTGDGKILALKGRREEPDVPESEADWVRFFSEREEAAKNNPPVDSEALDWDEIMTSEWNEAVSHSDIARKVEGLESEDIIKSFIEAYLTPDAFIIGGEQLADILGDYLKRGSELKVYMTEDLPELITRLSRLLNDGDSTEDHKNLLFDLAEADPRFKDESGDYNFIIRAMKHYLSNHTF